MDLNFDFNAIMQQYYNKVLKDNKELTPLIDLLNKYGIYGTKVLEFIPELATALQQCKNEREQKGGDT